MADHPGFQVRPCRRAAPAWGLRDNRAAVVPRYAHAETTRCDDPVLFFTRPPSACDPGSGLTRKLYDSP